MNKIKAYINYDDSNKIHYYQEFKIINLLPNVGDKYEFDEVIEIKKVQLDVEQPNDNIYNYDYYNIITLDKEYNEKINNYVCIEIIED